MDPVIEPTVDLREQVEAAFSAAEKVEPVQQPTEQAAPPTTTKLRDEQGKFAKAELTPPTEATPPAEKVEAATETPATTEQPKGPDLNRAPSAWKPSMREAWAQVPEEIRAEIHRREDEMAKGAHQHREMYQFGESMLKSLKPYEQNFKQAGIPFQQGMQMLLNADHIIRHGTPQQKWGVVQRIMQSAGLNPAALTQQQGQPQQGQAQQSQAEIRAMQVLQRLEQQEKQSAQKLHEEVTGEVMGFANDPKNEFFFDVKDDMATLIETGRCKTIPEAYQLACRMNDEVQGILTKRGPTSDVARKMQAAGQSARGGNPSGGAPSQAVGTDIRSIVEAQMNKMTQGQRV